MPKTIKLNWRKIWKDHEKWFFTKGYKWATHQSYKNNVRYFVNKELSRAKKALGEE